MNTLLSLIMQPVRTADSRKQEVLANTDFRDKYTLFKAYLPFFPPRPEKRSRSNQSPSRHVHTKHNPLQGTARSASSGVQ